MSTFNYLTRGEEKLSVINIHMIMGEKKEFAISSYKKNNEEKIILMQ